MNYSSTHPFPLRFILTLGFMGMCIGFLGPACAQNNSKTIAVQLSTSNVVRLEELTWPELEGKIKTGYTTVLVPTGGTEQGGPQLALGKHNFVVQYAAERIARSSGRVLVAPVLPFVPEGEHQKPTGNLLYPGTIGLSEETFAKTLIDVSTSLYLSGFKLIVLMGDHGQSISIQNLVAENLNKEWAPLGVRVTSLTAYYDESLETRVLSSSGIAKNEWGDHAGVADTSELWFVRAKAVRSRALEQQKFQVGNGERGSGASGRPERSSVQLGKQMMELRINAAVRQLKAFIENADK